LVLIQFRHDEEKCIRDATAFGPNGVMES